MDAGTYEYYFTQLNKVNERYVNILEGKYIKATVTVNPNGTLKIDKTELFEGEIGEEGAKLITTGEVLVLLQSNS